MAFVQYTFMVINQFEIELMADYLKQTWHLRNYSLYLLSVVNLHV